ncbi:MAG: hypothetical protein AABZ39_06645 [Spirochaetota bacterium]
MRIPLLSIIAIVHAVSFGADGVKRSALVPIPKPGMVFYVSPDGDDAWTGKSPRKGADGPFCTLEKARDAVRSAKRAGLPTGGIAVEIMPGMHERAGTFTLTAEDSGEPSSPIVYRGADMPVIVGGKRIRDLSPYKGNILKADVSFFGDIYFRQLFFSGKRQHLARYPNYDASNPYGGSWAYVAGSMASWDKKENKRSFVCREGDMRRWKDLTDVEVFIFPGPNYRNNIIGIASIDAAKRTITLARDADYGIRPVDRYYVRNIFEELDQPGEWYLDKRTKTLYFWPPSDLADGVVYAPTIEKMIVVSNASHIVFTGLTLECADDAAVTFIDCTDSLVAGSVIRNVVGKTSGLGAAVVIGGSNVGIVGCDIYDIGTTAVHLAGGERMSLTPAAHYAENNYIHHVGTVYTRGVGLNIDGVGQRAAHNLIHDCPRFALIFYGNDHIIEYNRLRHMNIQTEDTGATYCWGRDFLTARGSVIRYNHISDSLGYGKKIDTWISPYYAWGIYLDDDCAGVDVIGNIVANANRAGIHFHNARDIIAMNNIFINNGAHDLEMNGWNATHKFFISRTNDFDKAWRTYAHLPAWQKYRGLGKAHPIEAGFMVDNIIVNNIFYATNEKANVYSFRNFAFDRTTIDSNIIFHTSGIHTIQGIKADPDKQWQEWQRLGFDNNSAVADPLFVDAANGNYRLKPDSPAFALGFKQIPVEHIGPYQDALRVHWPIVEAEGVREHPIGEIDAPAAGSSSDTQRATAPKAKAVIDGTASPSEYPRLPLMMSQSPMRKKLDTPPCEARISHDTKELFIAVTVPVSAAAAVASGDSWGKDDGVELCFAVITEGTLMGEVFVLHGFTGGSYASVTDGGASAKNAAALRDAVKYSAVIGERSWTAEFAVPLAVLGINYVPGARIAFNAGVRRAENKEWVVWVGAMGATHKLDNGGILVLE